MKALEDSVEQTLLREEQALDAEEAALDGGSPDSEALQKILREMKAKYEVCLCYARFPECGAKFSYLGRPRPSPETAV